MILVTSYVLTFYFNFYYMVEIDYSTIDGVVAIVSANITIGPSDEPIIGTSDKLTFGPSRKPFAATKKGKKVMGRKPLANKQVGIQTRRGSPIWDHFKRVPR